MKKSIRTNPNPAHRQILKDLCSSDILVNHKIGIRNIVDAKFGLVHPVGLNVFDEDGRIFRPANFAHHYPIRRATIQYERRLAYLEATVDRLLDCRSISRPPSMYGPNTRAAELFHAPNLRHDNLNAHMGEIFGDAVLVSDVRVHYAVHPRLAVTSDALADLTGAFATPHRVARIDCRAPTILFDSEPIEEDLVNLKLMFA